MTTVPIAELAPSMADAGDKQIRAVVCLVWPFSSITHQSAFLIADPDFRQRYQKGQVRVQFNGPAGKAVEPLRMTVRDEVVLSLAGAKWVDPTSESLNSPGRGIDWELVFCEKLSMKVLRNGIEIADLDVNESNAPAPTKSTKAATNGIPATPLKSQVDGNGQVRGNSQHKFDASNRNKRPLSPDPFIDDVDQPDPKRARNADSLPISWTQDGKESSPPTEFVRNWIGRDPFIDSLFSNDWDPLDEKQPRTTYPLPGRWRLVDKEPSPPKEPGPDWWERGNLTIDDMEKLTPKVYYPADLDCMEVDTPTKAAANPDQSQTTSSFGLDLQQFSQQPVDSNIPSTQASTGYEVIHMELPDRVDDHDRFASEVSQKLAQELGGDTEDEGDLEMGDSTTDIGEGGIHAPGEEALIQDRVDSAPAIQTTASESHHTMHPSALPTLQTSQDSFQLTSGLMPPPSALPRSPVTPELHPQQSTALPLPSPFPGEQLEQTTFFPPQPRDFRSPSLTNQIGIVPDSMFQFSFGFDGAAMSSLSSRRGAERSVGLQGLDHAAEAEKHNEHPESAPASSPVIASKRLDVINTEASAAPPASIAVHVSEEVRDKDAAEEIAKENRTMAEEVSDVEEAAGEKDESGNEEDRSVVSETAAAGRGKYAQLSTQTPETGWNAISQTVPEVIDLLDSSSSESEEDSQDEEEVEIEEMDDDEQDADSEPDASDEEQEENSEDQSSEPDERYEEYDVQEEYERSEDDEDHFAEHVENQEQFAQFVNDGQESAQESEEGATHNELYRQNIPKPTLSQPQSTIIDLTTDSEEETEGRIAGTAGVVLSTDSMPVRAAGAHASTRYVEEDEYGNVLYIDPKILTRHSSDPAYLWGQDHPSALTESLEIPDSRSTDAPEVDLAELLRQAHSSAFTKSSESPESQPISVPQEGNTEPVAQEHSRIFAETLDSPPGVPYEDDAALTSPEIHDSQPFDVLQQDKAEPPRRGHSPIFAGTSKTADSGPFDVKQESHAVLESPEIPDSRPFDVPQEGHTESQGQGHFPIFASTSKTADSGPRDVPQEDSGRLLGDVDTPAPGTLSYLLATHDPPYSVTKEGIRTSLSYYYALDALKPFINSSSHYDKEIDVLAVVSEPHSGFQRAKRGRREYYTELRVIDRSFNANLAKNDGSGGHEWGLRVQCFSRHAENLPQAMVGDVILLRGFEVIGTKDAVGYGLRSGERSAWCVWKFDGVPFETIDQVTQRDKESAEERMERMELIVDHLKGWEEVRGPPVEVGRDERQEAARMKVWYDRRYLKHEEKSARAENGMRANVKGKLRAMI